MPSDPNSHQSDAQLLVKQYLGDDIDSTTRSADDTFLNAKLARKKQDIASLSSQLLSEEAAVKIQKSYRRFRDSKELRKSSFGKYGNEAIDLIHRYKEDGGRLREEPFASRIRLVLNFDINKTIIMSDKVQDGDMSFMVNSLLAECSWGRLEAGPIWAPVGRLATDRPAHDPRLMTYDSFLDSFLLPYEAARNSEAESRNTEIKAKRNDLKRVFTEPGNPGAMFRGVYHKLCEELRLPDWHSQNTKIFEKGLTHILPSFFNLLIHLQGQDRDFSIIFRTFGNDAEAVCEEMNMFCKGEHPRYPHVRMDGSDGRTDLRLISPDSLGLYHRASCQEAGTSLYIGASASDMSSGKLEKSDLERKAASSSAGRFLKGFKEINSYLKTRSQNTRRAYLLRDYYPFWKSKNERSNAGKLMLLDTTDKETLEVFFDDNIGHTSAHIVDAREALTGRSLPFQELDGKHLLRVEPLNAILDPHYFVRAVHECAVSWLKGMRQSAALHAHQNAGYRYVHPSAMQSMEMQGPPVINTSRRARELWSALHTKILAVIRLRRALQDQG